MPEEAFSEATSVDVCVCTFRRASLAGTLRSLAFQALPAGVRLRVIVADNDEAPTARGWIEADGRRIGLALSYRHCPARNISVARNGALEAATAEWVAFIDDDEEATPGWLAALLAEARSSGAEVVLGPVHAVVGPEAPAWMRDGAFHSTEPVVRANGIHAGYTSNALMRRRAPALDGLRFDLALGRSGGEDTEFFDRAVASGARISYAADAVVTEAVPPERARLGWLLSRRFRSGQTHGALLARRATGTPERFRQVLVAAGKAGACGAGAVVNLARPKRRVFWTLRAALHLGVVSRLCGFTEITQYGDDAPAAPSAVASGGRG